MNDIIILGAGPGGYELALEASKFGLKVVLIENSEVGGTCLNNGCIPTKAYYKSASLLNELKNSKELGIDYTFNFDLKTAKIRKDNIITTLKEGILFSLKKAGVSLINGFGKLVNKNTVQANDELFEAKYIVIATGSKCSVIPGFENFLTSEEILNLETLPKKMVIIGGGVIGIEMASILSAFGVEIEVVEVMDKIIPMCDSEVSKRLMTYLKKQGVKFHLNSKALQKVEGGVEIETKGIKETLLCDEVLMSVGRKPNVSNIGLEEVGIIFSKNGIVIDDLYKTNIDNIYAIGDVTGKNMLAHYATYSGYQVLSDITKQKHNINFNLVPNCVFSFPEVSWIGMNEDDCKALEIDYEVYKGQFKANGKAITLNESEGFAKIIVSDNHIIGAVIIGVDASTLIHEIGLAIYNNMSRNDFLDVIHAHPTLSEIFTVSLRQ